MKPLKPFLILCVFLLSGRPALSADYFLSLGAVAGNRYAVATDPSPVTLEVPVTVACTYPAGSTQPSDPLTIRGTVTRGDTTIAASVSVPDPDWGMCMYDVPRPGGAVDQCQITRTLSFVLSPDARFTSDYTLAVAVTPSANPGTILADAAGGFDFTLFSGRLTAGVNTVTFTSITLPASYYQTCAQASPNVTRLKGDVFDNDFTDNAANLCVQRGIVNRNGTVHLTLISGDLALGTVGGTSAAGLSYTLSGTTLTADGLSCASITVDLPDGVTVHEPDATAGRPNPRGLDHLSFSGVGPVSTPNAISLSLSAPRYLYSYGLPFWVGFSSLNLDFDSARGIVLPAAAALSMDMVHMIKTAADDPRRLVGFPSNTAPYAASGQTELTLTSAGLDGMLPFRAKTAAWGGWTTDRISPRTAFPKGALAWGAFDLTLTGGTMQPGTIPDVDFSMRMSGNCPEGICGDTPAGTDYVLENLTLGTGDDGALGGTVADVRAPTAFGKYNGARYTFEKDDTGRRAMLFFPGNRLPGTDADTGSEGRYTLSQYLFGSRAFDDAETLSAHCYLNDPDNTAARSGNHYFPGLTLGPGRLEPAVENGLTDAVDDRDLSLLLSGESTPVAIDVTPATKYVIRPGGITGVFNTTFSGPLSIYGYTLELKRFAFRSDVNRLDPYSFIDGHLDLPFPAELTVGFTSLELTCTGDMAGGQVDAESSGNRLAYWNAPVTLLGMGFEDTAGESACPDPANRQLRLDSSNTVRGLSRPVTLSAFWSPAGEPSQDTMTSAVTQRMDNPAAGDDPGFSVVLRDGYLNHDTYASTGVTGFTALNLLVDLPLFDDLSVLGHFQNDDDEAFTLYLSRDALTPDADRNGLPDAGYVGWTVDGYRAELVKNEETLSPDPRPEARYSWAGLINLNYPLLYQRATADGGPQFNGVKQTSHLPGGADPVITISSAADYLKPDTAKVSFGATADVAELQNFHVDLSSLTGNLDTFLADRLNVTLPIETLLGDLVDTTSLMRGVTGGDISGLLEPVLDAALSAGPVANGFDALSSAVRTIHRAPTLITSQIENRIGEVRSRMVGTLTDALTGPLDEVYNSDLAAFVAFDPVSLESTGLYSAVEIQTFRSGREALTAALGNLEGTVSGLRGQIGTIRSTIESLKGEIDGTVGTVSSTVTTVNNAIDSLTEYTSPDMATNPLLTEVNQAKNTINNALAAIKALDLGQIGDALSQAASLSGGTIDTSMIDEADAFLDTQVQQLEQLMTDAETQLESAISGTGLNTVFVQAKSRITFVETHISAVNAQITLVFDRLLVSSTGGPADNGYLGLLENGLASAQGFLSGFSQSISGDLPMGIDGSPDRAALAQMGRDKLDSLALSLVTDLSAQGGDLSDAAGLLLAGIDPANPANAFETVFQTGLTTLMTAPLDQLTGGLSAQIQAVTDEALGFIPDAGADDLKQMVKNAILNSGPVQELNTVFYSQFGFISDHVDDLTGQVTSKINGLINEAIKAVSDGLNAQLASVSSDIGGSGGGLSAAKMDGYALISQDELERIHIDAEFDFGGKPDPTIYYAILDITNWNADNGKGSGCPGDTAGTSMFDVVISTKDVKADMLGTDIGIKTASLGFTFTGLLPIGIFGNVYTSGELEFEAVTLMDMGLEAGIGAIENYLGAKATGRFEDYTISAVFFLGKTCDFEVLKRLDKDVTNFIGDHAAFTGVYVRGGAEIPIFNYGCALKVGVGAEVGAWYLTDPVPTYGGMFGGSAYGRVACLAALKGRVLLSGSKVGDQYRFYGMGWGAGGVGFCEPGKWSSVSKSRSDSWCVTGDATFEATYNHGWTISGPDVHCCY
ncbi:hypothetical protein JCM14469_02120 [Desulfatiferula olefinivorans]